MRVTFTITTDLPDEATDDQLDSIATDAYVQVNEPNEDVDLEASGTHIVWTTSNGRTSECCVEAPPLGPSRAAEFAVVPSGTIPAADLLDAETVIVEPTMCSLHPAYEADYCPRCGTATVIGGGS